MNPRVTWSVAFTLLASLAAAAEPAVVTTPLVIRDGGTPEKPAVFDGKGMVIDLGIDVTTHAWKKTDDVWTSAGKLQEREPIATGQVAGLFVDEVPLVIPRDADLEKLHPDRKGFNYLPPGKLKPGQMGYAADGSIYFRWPAGKKSETSRVILPPKPGTSCVTIACSHVVVKNITAKHAANDGFNIHGRWVGIRLENVKAFSNADEGISAHDDVQMDVANAEVAWNGSAAGGIADVNNCITTYRNCTVHDNLGAAFYLSGKSHRVADSVIYNQARDFSIRVGTDVVRERIDHRLPADWDAKKIADATMAGLITVTAPEVKGAHDADLVFSGGKAFIVYEANDRKAGESPGWPWVYAALSIVDPVTMKLEKVIPFARSGQVFANETLPEGACFVPRIVVKDARTLRCFFASVAPGKRQSQMWFIDFDTETLTFSDRIHRAKLKTAAGVFDMQPQHFHADAAAAGFRKPASDYGLYIFDSFKSIDGKLYVTLNNFPAGQNALATVNEALDTFEVVGHYNNPQSLKLTESAAHRLPDGMWLAVLRQEAGDRNYVFTASPDGRKWAAAEPRDLIPNGTASKPTFDLLGGVYHLGWQEKPPAGRPARAIFNVEVSADGKTWQRKYRFDTDKSFQYPVFREHAGAVYVAVTQGNTDPSRKERILFGRVR